MTEEKKGEEARRSPRRPAGWRCILKSPTTGMMQGRVENASAQGFLLEVASTLPMGEIETLKVEVMFSGKRWEFIAQAQVRHNVFRTSSCLVGVEITKITAKDAKFLHDFSYGII
ncbi:MAG: PilZ domain-containing protein [Hahellaceae bacterium]|jgi:hypothetical protein|nr:PilZ domain-containing protein [Hahellaceae bacterium]